MGPYESFAAIYRHGLCSIISPGDTYTVALVNSDQNEYWGRASIRADIQRRHAPNTAVLVHLARTHTSRGECWLNTAIQFCDSG